MVDGLTGQGEDPDLRHFAQHVFLVATQGQDLTSLRRVLHYLQDAERTLILTDSHKLYGTSRETRGKQLLTDLESWIFVTERRTEGILGNKGGNLLHRWQHVWPSNICLISSFVSFIPPETLHKLGSLQDAATVASSTQHSRAFSSLLCLCAVRRLCVPQLKI